MKTSTLATCATLLGAIALAPGAYGQGLELSTSPSRWRITYGEIEVNESEDMGLLGIQYELLEAFENWPGVFAGFGGYGSVAGDRGGFFSGGFSGGWRRQIPGDFFAEVGAFVGGGGGGATSNGTGMMLRPFAALEREVGGLGVRLELAKTDFPGGEIDDTSLSFGLSIPGELLAGRVATGWGAPIPMDAIDLERWRIGAGALTIEPSSGARTISGNAFGGDVSVAGLQLAAEISESSYIPIYAMGAVEGGVSGFATALGGYGRSGELGNPDLRWEVEGVAGMGGGGGVDTGGGLLLGASAGLRFRLAENWSAHASLGYLDAPNGRFGGQTIGFGIGWDPRMLRLRPSYDRANLATQQMPSHEGKLDVWQASAHYKIYHPTRSTRTESGGKHDTNLQLAGVGFERHISEHAAVVIRTAGAVEGDISGYAEGTLGLRLSASPFESFPNCQLHGTYEVGAGGGGGIDVSSGMIHQATVGWLWAPKPGIELGLDLGRMEAFSDGSFEAEVVSVSFALDILRIISAR